jgi:hypothetical protein
MYFEYEETRRTASEATGIVGREELTSLKRHVHICALLSSNPR